ncbi:MBL fold metallo-hydrolase [Anaerosphaera multitolerans]|uniref:MBL fold metallo-hydrolase n=1 Tax=Anaerosphaera multitolerans TaxID=2487351 RepID=A0A437S4B9_9FIRM|nr:MBL fold metallo-hydrolase [Anaerosphaera multitolerans]
MSEVYKGIFKVEIPLKGNPLKYINIYVIKSEDESLIVDTGFNTEEILELTEDYMKQLNIVPEKSSLYLTHLHSDHTGLVNYFDNLGLKIYMPDVDAKLLKLFRERYGEHWTNIEKYGYMQGLEEDDLKIEDHPGYKFRPREDFNYIPKNPGDILTIGNFNFKIIDLSGHTPGMAGLYDEGKSILFCGDHILGEITPNIQFWGFDVGDSLGTYFKNLEKVKDLNIKHLFSSHRTIIEDVNGRIDELLEHHDHRLRETVEALEKGAETVRDVTKQLQWDISAKNWDEFPKSQKWFAAGEAHAHLEHLRAKGVCNYRYNDGVLHYKLT